MEKENSYRFEVVKTTTGDYQVRHYYKAQPTKIDKLAGVINHLFRLDVKVLRKDPLYLSMAPDEIEVLESVREGILRRDESLEIRVTGKIGSFRS